MSCYIVHRIGIHAFSILDKDPRPVTPVVHTTGRLRWYIMGRVRCGGVAQGASKTWLELNSECILSQSACSMVGGARDCCSSMGSATLVKGAESPAKDVPRTMACRRQWLWYRFTSRYVFLLNVLRGCCSSVRRSIRAIFVVRGIEAPRETLKTYEPHASAPHQ